MSEEKRQTERVEEETADDPTRYESDEQVMTPPEEATGEERQEHVAGRGQDVSDDETYEGGPGW